MPGAVSGADPAQEGDAHEAKQDQPDDIIGDRAVGEQSDHCAGRQQQKKNTYEKIFNIHRLDSLRSDRIGLYFSIASLPFPVNAGDSVRQGNRMKTDLNQTGSVHKSGSAGAGPPCIRRAGAGPPGRWGAGLSKTAGKVRQIDNF